MKEHRKFVRLDARLPVTYRLLPDSTLQGAKTSPLSGGGICMSKNISGGGIGMVVDEPLRQGRV